MASETEFPAKGSARERGALEEIRKLLPYAYPHRTVFFLTLLTSVALAVIDVPIPFFLKRVIDAVLRHHQSLEIIGYELPPRRFLLAIFGGLASLAVGKGVLIYLQRMASEKMGQRMIYEVRMDLYRHLQSLSMPFFRSASTGRIMLRFMGDINAVLDMITDGFLRALMDTITILTVVVVILDLHWKLALVVLSVLPFYALTFLKLSPLLRKTGRNARHERSALSGNLQEKIAGAAVVKAFHQEKAEEKLVEAQTGRLRDWLVEKARIGGKLAAFAHSAVALGGALVLWMGGNAVLDGYSPVRVKDVRVDRRRLLRTSETRLDPVAQTAHVHYTVMILEDGKVVTEFSEDHHLRYYFPQEMVDLLESHGLEVVQRCPFLEPEAEITPREWNLTYVTRKSA